MARRDQFHSIAHVGPVQIGTFRDGYGRHPRRPHPPLPHRLKGTPAP
jgi:hypothetical protein